MISVVVGAIFLGQVSFCMAGDLVINEVFANPDGPSTELTEFVELYNLTDSNIDLSGYKLQDKFKDYLINEATISAHGFISFRKSETNISLNNSDEIIKLLDKNGDEIDNYSYGNTVETKSFSRIPDGTGQFVAETEPTENGVNQVPPSPTPSPAPSPSPSPVPTPTPNPTPSPSPEPTGMIPEGAATKTVFESEGDEDKSTESGLMFLASSSGKVKGSSESSQSVKNKKPMVMAMILVIVGLGLVGGTGVVFYQQQKYNDKNDKGKGEKKA